MNEETRQFIEAHAHDDVRQLALRGTTDPRVDLPFALQQIAGRQQAKAKIPSWAAIDGILYPPHLSMEQCSSEATARYKAAIAGGGELFVDLTAGFGVDAAFIGQRFRRVVCVERQPGLCAISSENFRLLGLPQAEMVEGDGTAYLHTMPHADLLYIDPARRDNQGGRTYGIADCTPNVLEMLDEMAEKADRILIKLSPMLDWRKAVADLGVGRVAAVHIVSVANECKELLILVEGRRWKGGARPAGTLATEGTQEGDMLRVVCVNLLSDGTMERFDYSPSSFLLPPSTKTPPSTQNYLYVPNASLMKAGCFSLLAERFRVEQLAPNSHLFVSDEVVTDFPGRVFTIEHRCSLNKRELKAALSGITRANIAVRNFPMSAADLRRRLKLQEGGETYIFATTVEKAGHQLFVCRKKS